MPTTCGSPDRRIGRSSTDDRRRDRVESGVLAGRQTHRVHARNTTATGRLHRPDRGRRAEAAHLASRRRRACRASRPTARSGALHLRPARSSPTATRSSSPCRSTAAWKRRCRCRTPRAARIRRTGGASPTTRSRARFQQWKHYRGGTASRIWLYRHQSHAVEKVPQPASRANDVDPMWIGNTVYFLSDRNGEFNIFSFDSRSKKSSS